MNSKFLLAVSGASFLLAPTFFAAQTIDLPTSKQLIGEIPGHPQRMNSLPMSMAVSPGGRYVVTVNAGYGTFESNYAQSLAVLDTQTGALKDFPDDRTIARLAKQTLYSGLAFSRDGKHIYASMASLSDPLGDGKDKTGNGVVIYSFSDGKIKQERMISLPLQQLAPGRKTKLIGGVEGDEGVPYAAAIAVVGGAGSEKLLVADNLSDDVLLLDPSTGTIEKRFDLSESDAVPSTYPIALAVSNDGARAFVALWNASEIVELDLAKKMVGRKLALLKPSSAIAPGTHPCAFEFSPDGKILYVALANRDALAAVNVGSGQFSVKGYFDTRLPGQSYFGAEPVALAINADGSRLYVANMASDAVAVIDTRQLTAKVSKQGMVEPIGFVPTEWMPISMAFVPSASGGKLYVATDKGKGTGPNNFPQRPIESMRDKMPPRANAYIATLLYGSLATLEETDIAKNLPQWTSVVLESNRMKAAAGKNHLCRRSAGPHQARYLHHQGKSDLRSDPWRSEARTESRWAMATRAWRCMAKRSRPTSTSWRCSSACSTISLTQAKSRATATSGRRRPSARIIWRRPGSRTIAAAQRTYDYEGVVAEGYPLLQKIPDVNEPASGYLWGDLAAHGKTYYHFGEYISTTFCNTAGTANPQQGPCLRAANARATRLHRARRFPRSGAAA